MNFQSSSDARFKGRVDPSVGSGSVLACKDEPSLPRFQDILKLLVLKRVEVGKPCQGAGVRAPPLDYPRVELQPHKLVGLLVDLGKVSQALIDDFGVAHCTMTVSMLAPGVGCQEHMIGGL